MTARERGNGREGMREERRERETETEVDQGKKSKGEQVSKVSNVE